MELDPPVFSYAIAPLPPNGIGRRWRWELFRGERMVAAGWHAGESRALHAVRTAASRAAHERHGLVALRPDRTTTDRRFLPGATVRLHCGAVACLLVPRDRAATAAASAA